MLRYLGRMTWTVQIGLQIAKGQTNMGICVRTGYKLRQGSNPSHQQQIAFLFPACSFRRE